MHLVDHYLQHLKHHKLTGDNYRAVSLQDLEAFEREHHRLPELLREIYLRLDGQRSHVLQESNYRLLPLEYIRSAVDDLVDNAEHHYGRDYSTHEYESFLDEGSVCNTPYHSGWIPFMEVKGNRYYAIDYAPEKNGKMQQILLLSANRELNQEPLLVYDNLEACIEDIIKTSFEDLDLDGNGESFEDFMQQAYEKLMSYDESAPRHKSALLQHLQQHIGKVELFHQDDELSLYHTVANQEHPYQLLLTVGMSQRAMNVPAGVEHPELHQFAELMFCLAPDFDLNEHPWIAQWLHILAHLPFQHERWLTAGHTLPLSHPLGDTAFTGLLIAPPLGLPRALHHVNGHDDCYINLFAIIPLHPDELALVQEHGIEALIPYINHSHLSAVFHPQRPSMLNQAS